MAPLIRRLRGRLARALSPGIERALAETRADLESLHERFDALGVEHHQVLDERDKAREALAEYTCNPFLTWRPPGHFYSPVPDPADFNETGLGVPGRDVPEVAGVDLRPAGQLELFASIAPLIDRDLVLGQAGDAVRYRRDNGSFDVLDAAVASGVLRHLQPSRLIEVGSGFSSALLLDTADRNHLETEFVFIEPYMDTLRELLRPDDTDRVTLLEQRVQDVDLGVFAALGSGDVLFIDSSHVVKPASDVVHLFGEVLPRLPAGVVVHVHDIFHPFEYPRDWIDEGRAWNEIYLVRALLSGGADFEVLFFTDWFRRFHRPLLDAFEPAVAAHSGGSLWMRKIR